MADELVTQVINEALDSKQKPEEIQKALTSNWDALMEADPKSAWIYKKSGLSKEKAAQSFYDLVVGAKPNEFTPGMDLDQIDADNRRRALSTRLSQRRTADAFKAGLDHLEPYLEKNEDMRHIFDSLFETDSAGIQKAVAEGKDLADEPEDWQSRLAGAAGVAMKMLNVGSPIVGSVLPRRRGFAIMVPGTAPEPTLSNPDNPAPASKQPPVFVFTKNPWVAMEVYGRYREQGKAADLSDLGDQVSLLEQEKQKDPSMSLSPYVSQRGGDSIKYREYLPGFAVVNGSPSVQEAVTDMGKAAVSLGLDPELPTVQKWGRSQGFNEGDAGALDLVLGSLPGLAAGKLLAGAGKAVAGKEAETMLIPMDRGATGLAGVPEARFKAASAPLKAPGASLADLAAKGKRDFFGGATPYLPKDESYAALRQAFIQHDAAPGIGKIQAATDLRKVFYGEGKVATNPIAREQLGKAILYNDMAADAQKGIQEFPFGENLQSVLSKQAEISKDVADKFPDVAKAIETRRDIWKKTQNDVLQAAHDAGIEKEFLERFNKDDYYRHIILEETQKDGGFHGFSEKVQDPTKRSFYRTRKGSEKDIYTNYADADLRVLTQLRKDIITLKLRKELNTFDIFQDLKSKVEEIRSTRGEEGLLNPFITPKEIRRGYNAPLNVLTDTEQAELDLVAQGKKPLAVPDTNDLDATKKWKEYAESKGLSTRGANGDLIAYRKGEDGRAKAFEDILADKSLSGMDRRLKIGTSLGYRRDIDINDIMPKGYGEYYFAPGDSLYPVSTVSEKQMQQMAEHLMDSTKEFSGLGKDDLKRAWAKGRGHNPMILPNEVIQELKLRNAERPDPSILGKAAQWFTGAFKKSVLHNPFQKASYDLWNGVSDAISLGVGKPSALKYMMESASELSPILSGKYEQLTPEVQAFLSHGASLSTARAAQLSDLAIIKGFSEAGNMAEKPGAWGTLKKAYEHYSENSQLLSDYRELIPRLSAYKAFKKEILDNGKPIRFYASRPEHVLGLHTADDQAYKMAADLIRNFQESSPVTKSLSRNTVPFVRWPAANAVSIINQVKNLAVDEGHMIQMAKAIGLAPGATSKIAANGAEFLMKLATLYGGLAYTNHTFFPKEEAELGEAGNKPHLVIGRSDTGKVQMVSPQDPYFDMVGWIGGSKIPGIWDRVSSGKESPLSAVKEMFVEGPTNRFLQGVNPWLKATVELPLGRSIGPDGRGIPIKDTGRYLARLLALHMPYAELTGAPSQPFLQAFKQKFIREIDPAQQTIYDTRDISKRFMENKGIKDESQFDSPTSRALYDFHLGHRFKDDEIMNEALRRFVANGGNKNQLKASLQNLDPTSFVPKKYMGEFLQSMTEKEAETFKKARAYYGKEILPSETKAIQEIVRQWRKSSEK